MSVNKHTDQSTPAASALLSSESLNMVTSPVHSVVAEESECESGTENESESDGEDDDDSATYDDDQKKSHTDYIELSIQSQFNN